MCLHFIIVLIFVESQRVTYRAPVNYVTKTWSVVLLNLKKKHLYSYLECIVYDKLKPRQSFRITLYITKLHFLDAGKTRCTSKERQKQKGLSRVLNVFVRGGKVPGNEIFIT